MSKHGNRSRDGQRGRQREYRARLKEERRPTRDDVARVALHWVIVDAAKMAARMNKPALMNKLEEALLRGLTAQGFDPKAADDVIGELIERYVEGRWTFRRKLHLQEGPPADTPVNGEEDLK